VGLVSRLVSGVYADWQGGARGRGVRNVGQARRGAGFQMSVWRRGATRQIESRSLNVKTRAGMPALP
jgi:hypothetical protein